MTSIFDLDGLSITWLGHASFLIKQTDARSALSSFDKIIYIDPFILPKQAEKADYILVTHEHYDHCDAGNVNKLRKENTIIIAASGCSKTLGSIVGMKAGDVYKHDMEVEAVHAYNVNKFRSPGNPFHPRGLGVGFVLEINGKRIYHAGDTDHIAEMSELRNIDVAMLPVGGTYTMTAEEAAEAAVEIKPKFLIPMHYKSEKYGLQLNNDLTPLAKGLAGKGVVLKILEPLA